MYHRIILLIMLALALPIVGCRDDGSSARSSEADSASNSPDHSQTTRPAEASTRPSVERLYGRWVAKDVDVKMGDVRIELTFQKDGPVDIAAWSDIPLVGQVRDKSAPYKVQGNTISSEALRGGTSVQYRFDQGDLIIEYQDGKTIRFRR